MAYLNLSKIGLLVLFMSVGAIHYTFAQAPEKLKVKPDGEEVSTSIRKQAYYYPDFKDGKVIFLSGVAHAGKLNYNMLSGEVEFINSKRDTLELDNMYTVSMVTFGPDSFYYDQQDKALLRLLEDYKGTKLLAKEKYELSNIKSVGAYGLEKNSTAPSSSSEYELNNTQNKLKQNESMVFSTKTTYYITQNNSFLNANKSSLFKLFPEHKTQLNNYIKANKTDFKKEEDVKKVLQYAVNL